MSTAEFFVLGVTHQRAPLVVRELLAFDEAEVAELHGKMAKLRGLRELVILGTCNRVEFYGVAETPAAIARLEAAFCANRRFAPEAFEALSFELTGAAAVQHLCEVAAGLDSQIVGETEIFGQVKAAFAAGEARRTVGPGLQRIFQKAFQTAKHVRTHTGIGRGSMSAANIAVELARKAFGDLSTARILLLGAGNIGEKTARAFRRSGAATIAVASRRLAPARALAAALGAEAVPLPQVRARLADFDIVVGSTAAAHAVVSVAAAAAAIYRRPQRPLFFIDLALPRDIAPGVAELANVFLYNLDDIATIAARHQASRTAEVARARAIIAERAESLWRDAATRLDRLTDGAARSGI